MWELTIKGNKKGVLLAWASALGYGNPDIIDEGGTEEEYHMECSIYTKYDASPYGDALYENPGEWDGSILDLKNFDEQAIRNGEYTDYLNLDPFTISGLFNIDLFMKHTPEDLDDLIEMQSMDFDPETGEFVPKEDFNGENIDVESFCDTFHYVKGEKC